MCVYIVYYLLPPPTAEGGYVFGCVYLFVSLRVCLFVCLSVSLLKKF